MRGWGVRVGGVGGKGGGRMDAAGEGRKWKGKRRGQLDFLLSVRAHAG